VNHLYGYPVTFTVNMGFTTVDLSDSLEVFSDGSVSLDRDKALEAMSKAERDRCLTCGIVLGEPKTCGIVGCTYNPRAVR
jgi:hypothetical protein